MQDPEEIVGRYVREGMNVLDIGCGMGFFSLPMAGIVGETGKVVCVDVQEKMIRGLIRRSAKAGLSGRIDARVCREDSLAVDDVAGKIDFALAFAVVHEVPDKERLFSELCNTLRQTGQLLFAEPKAHVPRKEFDKTVSIAQDVGFEVIPAPTVRRSYAVLLRKRQEENESCVRG